MTAPDVVGDAHLEPTPTPRRAQGPRVSRSTALVPITGLPIKGTVTLRTGEVREALRYTPADGGARFVDYQQRRWSRDGQVDTKWVRAAARLARTWRPDPSEAKIDAMIDRRRG